MNERLKFLRKELLKMTMEEFGKHLGVGKSAISDIENGRNNLSSQMLKSICREYGVQEEWLRDGTGEPFGAQTRNEEIFMFANGAMTQGKRVKELRKMLGLTLEKFGENLGVGKSTISDIENDRRFLTKHMLKSICREYGVREEWLRDGNGEPFGAKTHNEEILIFAAQGFRIKYLRKNLLQLSAEKFGERIGFSQSAISNIENGTRSMTAQMAKSICREYGVREEWLRDGIGEPFDAHTINQELLAWINRISPEDDTSFKKRFAYACSKLSDDGWNVIEQFCNDLIH